MIPLKDDNPSNTAPVVTVALIVLNALVFVYQISLQAGGPDGVQAAQAFIEEFNAKYDKRIGGVAEPCNEVDAIQWVTIEQATIILTAKPRRTRGTSTANAAA